MNNLLKLAKQALLSDYPDFPLETLDHLSPLDVIATAYHLYPERMPMSPPPEIQKRIQELRRKSKTQVHVEGDRIVIEIGEEESK